MKFHHLTNVTAILTIFVVLLTPGFAQSKPTNNLIFTSEQITNLRLAHTIGKEVGHPTIIQSIMLQESNGGTNPRLNSGGSYGIMQVQVVAARSVFTHYPDTRDRYFPNKTAISNADIIKLLMTNKEANIRIAVRHFSIYLKLCKGDLNKTIAGYNMGIGRVLGTGSSDFSTTKYVKQVRLRQRTDVDQFNRTYLS